MAISKPSEEEKTSSEEEETSYEEEDDQQQKSLSSEKKSTAVKPQPAVSSSSSSSSSESGTESDSKAADQPISSSQAVHEPKRTKKRGHGAVGDDETRAAESGGKKAVEEPRKRFQRLWSEKDEIALLKGMIDFPKKTGFDSYKEINAFHDFMKDSIHVHVSKEQLLSKIKKMKQKYAKIKKNDADYRLKKPHNIKAFELSKKIWAIRGETELTKSNKKDENILKKSSNTDGNVSSSLIVSEMIRFDKNPSLSGLDEDYIMRGVELIGPSKRAELEDMWKELRDEEFELFVKRSEAYAYQATLIRDAIKQPLIAAHDHDSLKFPWQYFAHVDDILPQKLL